MQRRSSAGGQPPENFHDAITFFLFAFSCPWCTAENEEPSKYFLSASHNGRRGVEGGGLKWVQRLNRQVGRCTLLWNSSLHYVQCQGRLVGNHQKTSMMQSPSFLLILVKENRAPVAGRIRACLLVRMLCILALGYVPIEFVRTNSICTEYYTVPSPVL